MTICVATICQLENVPYVVVVADRQITAGDVKYEPANRTKLWMFDPEIPKDLKTVREISANVVALQAGEDSAYTALAIETEHIAKQRNTGNVLEIAEIYRERFMLLRQRRAEDRYLAPLELDSNTWITKQQAMRPEIAAQIKLELTCAELDVEAIIAGVDGESDHPEAHIYTIKDPIRDEGVVACQDGIGFAAVGEGGRHAESVFMIHKYDAGFSADNALVLTFMGKRRAELASSVGRRTDMFILHHPDSPLHLEHGPRFLERFDWYIEHLEATERNMIRDLSEYAKAIFIEKP